MGKKLFVVSKTHLDLGFTDYAENILNKYVSQYIPSAIKLAEQLNSDGNKQFVWTTGSWILLQALKSGDKELVQSLTNAIKNGGVAAHALAFTTHTELLDSDLFEYSLSLIDEIDKISGRKTISAKMTDVPGHTSAIVPKLAKHGIKLLHIGVNGASPVPIVPECFLWKCGGEEVVVIYSGDYGGVFKCDYIDDILYFDHTLDNRGTKSASAVVAKINSLKAKYSDYEVCAGTIDDIAEKLWNVREKLPVVESEIGDTWIHGVATDPYKVAAFRKLCALKTKWLTEGSLTKDSEEYRGFADSLLCVAEHTWGMDVKVHFADMENYLKKDFVKARKKDVVRVARPFVYFPNSFATFIKQTFSKDKLKYSSFEKSWAEQRGYIEKALLALNEKHLAEAKAELDLLRPKAFEMPQGEQYQVGNEIAVGDNKISLGANGGVNLVLGGKEVLKAEDKPIVEYRSYGAKDYDFWLNNYTRNHLQTKVWSDGDFARPGLKRVDKKFPKGVFPYTILNAVVNKNESEATITAQLDCPQYLKEELGAPRQIYVNYNLSREGLKVELVWLDKDAARTTESIAAKFYTQADDGLKYVKMDEEIDPKNIVSKGGRKLLVCSEANFEVEGKSLAIKSEEAPLVATDGGNILHFDDSLVAEENCLTYVLYNNVWGTNFPLWYEENAKFTFDIKLKGYVITKC